MVAAIILAAGESRRFGSLKQLATFEGRTLLARALSAVTNAEVSELLVVTGAHSDQIAKEIDAFPTAHRVQNLDWHEGRASSIRAGLRAAVTSQPGLSAVIFTACDQPLVTSALLNDMIRRHRAHLDRIVACEYAGTVGIPMLIPCRFFSDLLALTGEEGARSVAEAHPQDVERIAFPEGAQDIDTIDDLAALRRDKSQAVGHSGQPGHTLTGQ